MSKHTKLLWLTLIALSLASPPAVLARTKSGHFIRSVWVDSVAINLTEPHVVGAILQQPVDRIIVPCFEGGKTIFPTSSKIFSQMPQYCGKADVINVFIRGAHKSGRQVYVSINCLHWRTPGMFSNDDIFVRHPELVERNLYGGCGEPADGMYASPIHPKVQQALVELVTEVGARYPSVDGVLLTCRLAPHAPLGYSEATRQAYIHAKQIDPIDISFSNDAGNFHAAHEWVDWRLGQMQILMSRLSKAFRRKCPNATVATTGYDDWERLFWTQQSTTLEDWPRWADNKLIDEVMLEPAYSNSSAAPTSPEGINVDKADTLTNQHLRSNIVVSLRDGGASLDPLTQIESMQNDHTDGLTLYVTTKTDMAYAQKFWTHIFPVIEPVLQASEK